MKLLKEALAVLGALILLAVMAVIVMPKATRAVVAALVRDEDQPARHPFVTFCSTTSPGKYATCSTPAIPAGEEVVIETVSVSGNADPGNLSFLPELTTTSAGTEASFAWDAVTDVGFGQPKFSEFAWAHSMRLYADPGTSLSCQVGTAAANPETLLVLNCHLSGYWVSLP